jgi:hypothetical protein
MGHSYKGQAVPFVCTAQGGHASPAPVLFSIEGGIINWVAVTPPGYNNIETQQSIDAGVTWTVRATGPESPTGLSDTPGKYIRARFTNGTAFTDFSNVIIIV